MQLEHTEARPCMRREATARVWTPKGKPQRRPDLLAPPRDMELPRCCSATCPETFCFRSSGKWKRHLSARPLRWSLCLVSLESQPCFYVWWISSSAREPLIALQAELGASLSTWVGDCPQTPCIYALNVFFFEASWVGLWVCLTILFLLRIPSVQCRVPYCMFRWTGTLRRHNDGWLPLLLSGSNASTPHQSLHQQPSVPKCTSTLMDLCLRTSWPMVITSCVILV